MVFGVVRERDVGVNDRCWRGLGASPAAWLQQPQLAPTVTVGFLDGRWPVTVVLRRGHRDPPTVSTRLSTTDMPSIFWSSVVVDSGSVVTGPSNGDRCIRRGADCPPPRSRATIQIVRPLRRDSADQSPAKTVARCRSRSLGCRFERLSATSWRWPRPALSAPIAPRVSAAGRHRSSLDRAGRTLRIGRRG